VTHQPEPIVRGRRTFLRAAEREDVPKIVPWFNDHATTRFISARAPMSIAQEERWFEGMLERQGKDAWSFLICRLGDDAPIGTIGLFDIDQTNGSAGLGISLGAPTDTGQGLGTDALEAMLDFGFGQLRLERLWLHVYDFNERAIRSYEKAGFREEGRLREAVWRDGRWWDEVQMGVIEREWRERFGGGTVPAAAAAR
jgi:RimJ/RimL family protein N-acetyltransferase